MMEMKKAYILFFSALVAIMSNSCAEKYDDTELQKHVDSLENRVSSLENQVSSLNANVLSLSEIIKSLEENLFITSVTDIPGGFRLTYSDNTYIDLYNGSDGKDGQNGANGKDGATPAIGVESIGGVYYWTITINGVTSYLYDADGKIIPVLFNAHDGADGRPGITPRFRVDADGYWMVSYDEGASYSYLYDLSGNRISALGNQSNQNTISYSDYGDYVYLYLPNGQSLSLAKYKAFNLYIAQTKGLEFNSEKKCSVNFQVTGADNSTHIEFYEEGNIQASRSGYGISSGTINVVATGEIDENTKLYVFLYNDVTTVTKVLTFNAIDTRIDDVVPGDIRDDLDEWIEIYNGVNPPNVEGCYIIDPMVAVYCQDYGNGGYEPGRLVSPAEIRFFDQDMTNNTISYEEYEGSGYLLGEGAFISGYDSYFTVFFNTTGHSNGIYIKTALVISGQKTSVGIANCKYAFVMVEKGPDPSHLLMAEGVFRVFKDEDGMSYPISWSHARGASNQWDGVPEVSLNIFSIVK